MKHKAGLQRMTKLLMVLPLLFTVNPVSAQAPGGPPQEAFSACQGKSSGGSCGFAAPHGRISGQCRQMREPRLVCVPAGGPPQRGGSGRSMSDNGPGGNSMPGTPPPGRRISIASSNPDGIEVTSRIPDTGQGSCFNNRNLVACQKPGQSFYGQDAHYQGVAPNYRDNGDGTVSDLVTGLLWQKAHNDQRLDWQSARSRCESMQLGGRNDWRLPSITELFSIADFAGVTGSRPFVNPVFDIREPDASILQNDRFASNHRTDMMGQTWSSTIYAGDHWNRPGVEAAFFFNVLDGRIKQAPTRGRIGLFYRCVSGKSWGSNQFVDNRDGTVTDRASGLMWQQSDDGQVKSWQEALSYCQNSKLGGYEDWRLPNVKSLQSIVDYRRYDPAINPEFFKQRDKKGWFWSSTTLGEDPRQATYVCFGKCISVDGVDVHGAGAQRSDPKYGNLSSYRNGMGGQRDQVRIKNYARCVRSAG